ncbi:MAG: DUF4492 domain-containing protein [Alistipes sp.]|nr:DUF4492 domain-containing protein [Alistipes sp.]
MKRALLSIYNFYVDGFKSMTWGRELWWLILLKVIILFAVLRLFFFKPTMSGMSDDERIDHVEQQLIIRDTTH